jgi:hypothetical protein
MPIKMRNDKRNNGGFKILLFLVLSGSLIAPFISSCGKAGPSGATALNIKYQVVNLSPDLGPISLYIDYRQYNNLSFYYPRASGYFALSSIDTPFQVRSAPVQISTTQVASQIYFPYIDNILHPNFKYTLFITGLRADSSVKAIFLTDTALALPPLGYGKVRFLNASPLSGSFDVYANGATATGFKGLQYNKVSPYVQMPAGNYTFQIYPAGTNVSAATAGAIGSYANLTVQDGRIYTIYSYGISGRTDTLAFGTGAIANQ